jgi:hypothetical protein
MRISIYFVFYEAPKRYGALTHHLFTVKKASKRVDAYF